ncbi:hypothetical protein GCM10009624_27900 [Gordonia sinesedis]
MSAIAHHPPLDRDIYRGELRSREYVEDLRPGESVAFGLSSFTEDVSIAHDFAVDPTQGGHNTPTLPEGADQSVLYRVSPGARGVPTSGAADEEVAMGTFRVVDKTMLGEVHVVTLEQTDPLEQP